MKRQEELVQEAINRSLGRDSVTPRQNQLMNEAVDRIIGKNNLGSRVFEEENKVLESVNKRLNQTISGFYAHPLGSARESLTREFAAITAQLTHGIQFPTPRDSLSVFARQI